MEIKVNIHKFLEQFNNEYSFLYDSYDNVAGYREALEFGDNFIKQEKNKDFVREFCMFRGDFLTSDREVAAFAFTLEVFELI